MYKFIIDSDIYSGNWIRGMMGYLTGQGDNEYAEVENGELYLAEVPEYLQKEIIQIATTITQGEHKAIPGDIEQTPGYYNNGFGVHYHNDADENLAIAARNKSILETVNMYAKVYKGGGEDEKAKRIREDARLKITEPLTKYPAYQSMSIYFYKKPSNELSNLLKERAHKFSKDRPDPFNIIGFRLIEVDEAES